MSTIINRDWGERRIKLRIEDSLHINAHTVKVIDVESGQTLDGVTEIELPAYTNSRLYGARVTLIVTEIEVIQHGISITTNGFTTPTTATTENPDGPAEPVD